MSSSRKHLSKLSLRPYIGTRDFFPSDMRFRNWLFEIQRRICKNYGYEEYSAPLLEPLELYLSKSSEEILSKQIYQFQDRGERDVVIRPEMTPTLARMVSQKQREIPWPIRWFNIGNFMRYERPGRGRLREFFQLNVDLLGTQEASVHANQEVLSLAIDIFFAYGAKPNEFQIRYNDRRLFDAYLGNIESKRLQEISRLLDRRTKIEQTEFAKQLKTCCPEKEEQKRIEAFIQFSSKDFPALAKKGGNYEKIIRECQELEDVFPKKSLHFDPNLMRGFDYYTSFIFEIYDSDPQNNRSLLGGGRYDDLLGSFGTEKISAVGFGMGDVTLENFLISHHHIPSFLQKAEGVFLCLKSRELQNEHFTLAQELRKKGIEVEQALSPTRKLGRQFEMAQKKNRRFVIILGEEELSQNKISIKDLNTGKQEKIPREKISEYLLQNLET